MSASVVKELAKAIQVSVAFFALTLGLTQAVAQTPPTSIPPLEATFPPAKSSVPTPTPMQVPAVNTSKTPTILPGDAPDPKANPMLAQYIQDGMQLYYLGTRSNLDGWFLVKDGRVQIVYTTPDKQSMVIGVLYGTDSQAITEGQVSFLSQTHPEIASMIQESARQSGQNYMQMGQNYPQMGQNYAPKGANSNLILPQSPGEKLVKELQMSTGVGVGSSKAPMLYMVMDPNCSHCQATWRALRDAVFKNSLQIQLVPIGRNDEDERAAAVLLKAKDPLNTWDKYVSGDKTQLAGDSDPLALAAVKTNHTFVDRWSIKETPYIVYRAKDGKIKIIAGEPQKPEEILKEVGP